MEYLAKEPFIVSVCGPRKSGKSYLTKTVLREEFVKTQDEIHILCKSLNLNDDYDEFRKQSYKYKDKFHFYADFTKDTMLGLLTDQIDLKEDEMNFKRKSELIHNIKGKKRKKIAFDKKGIEEEAIVQYYTDEHSFFTSVPIAKADKPKTKKQKAKSPKAQNILIILDDVVDTGILNYHTVIDTLAMRGRHANISVWSNSQRISPISVNVRDNSDMLILFQPFSIQEFESAIDKFIPKAYRKKIRLKLEEIFEQEFNFLVINNMKRELFTKIGYSTTHEFVQNKIEYLDLRNYMDDKTKGKKK